LSFVFFYVATFILVGWARFPFAQWGNLISVGVATALTVAIWERGQWPIGLLVAPRLALPELLRGLGWGFVLISGCAALIVLSTGIRHQPGRGFPWLELMAVFLPAVLHEELLFRGYPFQKLLRWNGPFAILVVSLIFAGLHAGNSSVTTIGLVNIFLGGILLSLAYMRYGRLWFPIGFHLAWNLTTGPILGHEVSGYESMRTLLIEVGGGPDLLTGGEFGIEGSLLMTLAELVAIALLIRAAPNMIRAARVSHAGKRSNDQ
jgi:membrane protease YdiL (CAAX protease family)